MVQCQPMLWSKSNSSALSPIPFNIFIFGLDDRVKSVLISYVNDIKLGGPLCSPMDKIVTFRNRELEETTRNNEILLQNPNYASRKPGIISFLTVSQTNSWSCLKMQHNTSNTVSFQNHFDKLRNQSREYHTAVQQGLEPRFLPISSMMPFYIKAETFTNLFTSVLSQLLPSLKNQF